MLFLSEVISKDVRNIRWDTEKHLINLWMNKLRNTCKFFEILDSINLVSFYGEILAFDKAGLWKVKKKLTAEINNLKWIS